MLLVYLHIIVCNIFIFAGVAAVLVQVYRTVTAPPIEEVMDILYTEGETLENLTEEENDER